MRRVESKSLKMPQCKFSQLNSQLQRNRCYHNAIRNILIANKSGFIITAVTAEHVDGSMAASHSYAGS